MSIQRQPIEAQVVGARVKGLTDGPHVGLQAAVGYHHTLGRTRGTRGVLQKRHIVVADLGLAPVFGQRWVGVQFQRWRLGMAGQVAGDCGPIATGTERVPSTAVADHSCYLLALFTRARWIQRHRHHTRIQATQEAGYKIQAAGLKQ